MLPEIWEPKLMVVFVEIAVPELSDKLGFHHLHPRDRFWELLEIGGITPQRIITPQERKALTDGYAKGNLSDPVRSIFVEKKTSQMLRLGIGLTALNRRTVAADDKDKSARPTPEDIEQFIARNEKLIPKILAFLIAPEAFVELFKNQFPSASNVLGLQPFTIGTSEVWLLGATSSLLRGEKLTQQEDAFFELGERIAATRGETERT